MGRSEQKRCAHCNDVYSWWWGSTPYTHDPDNGSTHCPECHKAVRLALEAIPKKQRKKYVETDKFTRMDLDPNTPEPTDLPPKVDRELVLQPMRHPSSFRMFEWDSSENFKERQGPLNAFKIGPEPSLTDKGLCKADSQSSENLVAALTESLDALAQPGSLSKARAYAGGYGDKTLKVKPLPEGLFPPEGFEGDIPEFDLPSESDPVPEKLGEFLDGLMEHVELAAVTTCKLVRGCAPQAMTGESPGSHLPYTHQYLRSEHKGFSTERLPVGVLPLYDREPDISPLPMQGATPPIARRVESRLCDMLDPVNEHKAGHVVRDGVTYYYEWWTRTGKAAGTVKMVMAEDVRTGEILGPWKDFR